MAVKKSLNKIHFSSVIVSMKNFQPILLSVSLILFAVGCATQTEPPPPPPTYVDPTAQGSVAGVGIESQDLITATDKLVRKMLETKEIQGQKGITPVIGLLPVQNRTRFAIDKDIFLTRMKVLLNEKANGQIKFIARDRIESIKKEKELKDKGEVTSGSRKKLYGVDYFLTGELSGLSTATQRGKSDYMLFTFRLIDSETSEEIWESYHELKKEGAEDAVYR
jgi:PBP1b-binding outer membrane lipoprotein LpoB